MKTNLKRIIFLTALATGLFVLSGCYTPSPLYGTWMNDSGDSINFVGGGEQTFTANFINATGVEVSYSGKWDVQANVLVITIEKEDGNSVTKLTEWDIYGAVLKLRWTDNLNEERLITLYHVAK